MTDPTILIAFGAGLLSFFAPCILPLVPGFLAYLGGAASETHVSHLRRRMATFHASVFFVAGFVLVFALLGVLVHGVLTSAGAVLQVSLARVGGVVMIFFGLYLMRLIRVPFLERTRQISVHTRFSSKSVSSFVFGSAFAMGWTPCAGAALGAILGLATLAPAKAFFLLLAYALGLGLPFLIIGAFAGEIERYLNRSFSWMPYVNILFGGILVFTGALAFTQNLSVCRDVLWSFPF